MCESEEKLLARESLIFKRGMHSGSWASSWSSSVAQTGDARSELLDALPALVGESCLGGAAEGDFFVKCETWLSIECVDDRKKFATRCGISLATSLPMAGKDRANILVRSWSNPSGRANFQSGSLRPAERPVTRAHTPRAKQPQDMKTWAALSAFRRLGIAHSHVCRAGPDTDQVVREVGEGALQAGKAGGGGVRPRPQASRAKFRKSTREREYLEYFQDGGQ